MRRLVHIMFISNNHTLFYLWWKEIFLKHQEVSEYYENDCSLSCFFGSVKECCKNVVKVFGFYFLYFKHFSFMFHPSMIHIHPRRCRLSRILIFRIIHGLLNVIMRCISKTFDTCSWCFVFVISNFAWLICIKDVKLTSKRSKFN